jgi:hypothetical protein
MAAVDRNRPMERGWTKLVHVDPSLGETTTKETVDQLYEAKNLKPKLQSTISTLFRIFFLRSGHHSIISHYYSGKNQATVLSVLPSQKKGFFFFILNYCIASEKSSIPAGGVVWFFIRCSSYLCVKWSSLQHSPKQMRQFGVSPMLTHHENFRIFIVQISASP